MSIGKHLGIALHVYQFQSNVITGGLSQAH